MTYPTLELAQVCRMDRQTTAAVDAIERGFEFVSMEHVDPATGRITIANGSRTGNGKGQAFLFDERHVLFGKLRPYLRKIALPDAGGCSSTELVPLLPDESRLDRAYLFHWLRQQKVIDALMDKCTGARMPRADMNVLLGMTLPLPPLEEQQHIVELLDRAAEIRRRADAARAHARTIIPALFLETFGDPAINPKGWPVVTVGDLALNGLRNGISPSRSGTISGKVLTLSAITRGMFDPFALKDGMFASPLSDDQAVSASLFLICRGNGNRDLVGQGAFPPSDMPGVAFPDTMIALKPDTARVDPLYLSSLWSSQHVRAQVHAAARTTNGTYKINQQSVASFRLPLPPQDVQAAYAEQAERVEILARSLNDAAAKAEAIAAALAAEIFHATTPKGNGHPLSA